MSELNDTEVLSRLESAGVIQTSASKALEINQLSNWVAQCIDYDHGVVYKAIIQFYCKPEGKRLTV